MIVVEGRHVVVDILDGGAREGFVEAGGVGWEDVCEVRYAWEASVVVGPSRAVGVCDDARARFPDDDGGAVSGVEVADFEARRARAPLVRIGQGGLDVAYAVDRRVPVYVRVSEDVDVRVEAFDAVPEEARPDGLGEGREEEVPFFPAEARRAGGSAKR